MISGDIEVNPGPMTDNIIDIVHLNIRSIRHEIDYLNTLVHDFDILCFTETHLDDTVSNDSLSLDVFNTIYRKDRNCYGDRVMIYVSNIIQVLKTRRTQTCRCRMFVDRNHKPYL